MSLRVTSSGEPPAGWDDAIAEKGGLLQSTYWGSLMAALGRGAPLYLQAMDGETPVASLLAIHLREKGGGTVRRLALALLRSGGRIEFGDGPVVHDEARAGEAVAALLDALQAYAAKNRVLLIRANGLSAASRFEGGGGIDAAFAARGFSPARWGTYLVDLSPDEDALLMSLEHSARKGIRKAAREGVRVAPPTGWEDYR